MIEKLKTLFCKTIFLTILVISAIAVKAQTASEISLKIFCIGNSITAGARTVNPEIESYPAVLQSMLVNNGYKNYKITNLGIGGATIIRYGKPNIWPVLDSIKKYIPDIVIIKAGTNETVGDPRFNWEHIADFEKDYSEYLLAIRNINPKCKIIICSPLDMFPETPGLSDERLQNLKQRKPRILELRKRVKKIAKKNNLFFLDLTRVFKHKMNLITQGDGVHPNSMGYNLLATEIYTYLKRENIIHQ